MSAPRFYVTTAIPYVNGDPHVGFALECVQADVLARHRRQCGDDVRFLTGTDDNSLKNVAAAESAGVPVSEYVAAKTRRFAGLREPLRLSYDDFIRTSVDPRHRIGVERLWRACAAAGDLYERDYRGLYCRGCDAFVSLDELDGGTCPEHEEAPEEVAERNWFFRLSRYEEAVREAIQSGRLRIEPEHRRNEVLGFIRDGLSDFSVSRSVARAGGWGIPVPDDPSQVVYVWFDALGNYVTALDYGEDGDLYGTWWKRADERVHVIGKGIVRFHAVYWPALLLSAGAPLPTAIFVHEHLTADGRKLAKSVGTGADPAHVASRYGADALRWWFVRGVRRTGDTDFREELVAASADELADGLGNLVNRAIALAGPRRLEEVTRPTSLLEEGLPLLQAIDLVGGRVDDALRRFDFSAAADGVWSVVAEANRFVSLARPWELARAAGHDADAAQRLEDVLALLLTAIRVVTEELRPFLPDGAARIERAVRLGDAELGRTLFPKAPPAAEP